MRDLFLLDPTITFLNHGSFGACPREVLEVQQALQREMEGNPVAFLARESGSRLLEARERLADHLGARGQDVIFLPNTTHGVNTAARSLELRQGDEVLSTDHEYGACDATWAWVCARSGARYRRVEVPLPFQAATFADRIWAEVGPRTRVLFLSHLTSTTALTFPLAELCRRARAAGILTVIDGAHIPGQRTLDLDALGADLYTGNCHKWLCAPKGAAFLHARPEHHGWLEAGAISWGYHEALGNASYTGTSPLERRLQWQGTRDLTPFLAVPAAIAFQARHDWAAVRGRCHALAQETLIRMGELTGLEPVSQPEDFAQMVAIPVPAMEACELKDRLLSTYRIEIPVTQHRDQLFVRLSIQAYNTSAEAEALVEALRTIFRL